MACVHWCKGMWWHVFHCCFSKKGRNCPLIMCPSSNLQHRTILQATRHYCPPPHPASLLLRRLFSMTKSTVQLTLGNYSPPSKLCSTLLLPPQLLTSLLITL